jgi:cytochrome c-type biogenesis protein
MNLALFLASGGLGVWMPEVLRLALLAFPAGLVGFIAAPCCSLLVPVYLPSALVIPAAPVPVPASRQLVLLNQPGENLAAPASPAQAGLPTPPTPAPSRSRALRSFAAFLAGFCLFFVALGATASTLGGVLLAQLPSLERISGAFIIVLGVIMLSRLRIKLPGSKTCVNVSRLRSGPFGAFGMGFAIAITWTPCTGPTLGGILALSAASATVWTGSALLLLYALGLAVPFALMTIALTTARRLVEFQRRHARILEIAGGVLMIAVGVLILQGGWQGWLGPATGWLNNHGWPPI